MCEFAGSSPMFLSVTNPIDTVRRSQIKRVCSCLISALRVYGDSRNRPGILRLVLDLGTSIILRFCSRLQSVLCSFNLEGWGWKQSNRHWFQGKLYWAIIVILRKIFQIIVRKFANLFLSIEISFHPAEYMMQ